MGEDSDEAPADDDIFDAETEWQPHELSDMMANEADED